MKKEIIELTPENYKKYDLFCKKSKKSHPGYQAKEQWVEKRFKEGLKIFLLRVYENNKWTSRGFIEYILGESCWRGIHASNYLVIHCLWVVGRQKGQGFGSELLQKAIEDAKHHQKAGVAVVVTNKTWMVKSPLFEKHGFETVDHSDPYFDLLVYQLNKDATKPYFIGNRPDFNPFAVLPIPLNKGLTMYYGDQCPYLIDLAKMLEEIAQELGLKFQSHKIETSQQAQACMTPYGVNAIYLNGKFLTYTYETRTGFIKLIKKHL